MGLGYWTGKGRDTINWGGTIEADNFVGNGSLLTGITAGGSGGAASWGLITGTLSTQTDLQNELNAKVDENAAIVGATKTKLTYDTKGLITAGADATTADINDSSNRRYVTDANLVVIGNTSNTNTGDQDLSGYALNSSYQATSSAFLTHAASSAIHINHNEVSITTANGLAGGGNLSASREVSLSIVGLAQKNPPLTVDELAIYSVADGANKKITIDTLPKPNLNAVTNPVADKTFDMTSYALIFDATGTVTNNDAFKIGGNKLNVNLLHVSDLTNPTYSGADPCTVRIVAGGTASTPLLVAVNNNTAGRVIQVWRNIVTNDVGSIDNQGVLTITGNLNSRGRVVRVVNTAGTLPGINNYAVLATDELITVSPTALGLVNVNLPAANTYPGMLIKVENITGGAAGANVVPNGADTINGVAANWVLNAQWQTVNLVSDNANNWAVL